MREDLPYVYFYFRRKGFGRALALSMALHCCDPSEPMKPENTK